MQLIYLFGAFVFAPLIALADPGHVGAEPTTAWYQETTFIVIAILSILTLGVLLYGWRSKQKYFIAVPAVALVAVAITGLLSFSQLQNSSVTEMTLAVADFGAGQSVTLYKDPNCGCCSGYANALRQAGFDVTIEETSDMEAIKQANGIPAGSESCHTSIIGDYVVEGHVPLAAVEKLVTEKPDIAGIGLPGMPSGTPGMPGPKTAPYEVYQLSDGGEINSYITM